MGGQFSATAQFYLYGKKYCTRNGWLAAKAAYKQPDIVSTDISLKGKTYIITGANAGIGYGITKYLAEKQATVYMLCRSKERGEKTRADLQELTNNPNLHLIVCNCGVEVDIRRAWNEFVNKQKQSQQAIALDGLICNAGCLNHNKVLTSEGIEETFATHLLFGTYLLVNLCLPALNAKPYQSRVILVSSGGMYNTKVPDWKSLSSQPGCSLPYNGNLMYAYCKRAQVLLGEEWTKLYPNIKFVSCHPGWVDTGGVDAAYGTSKSYLEPLRSIWEGAEGIIWLAIIDAVELMGGEFYLDRNPCVKHLAGPFFTEGNFTKNSKEEVLQLLANLESWSSAETRKGAV